jgi:ribosomal protein S18 acetylase RimI-like enzyme
MNLDRLDFKVNACSERDIQSHLSSCDRQFNPPLSDRVDIGEYSKKLRLSAFTFEAWKDESLVGLVAAYMNIPDHSCFITSTSVLPDFWGRGIAAKLLAACLRHAHAADVEIASLEVWKDSHPAICLYRKFGFQVAGQREGFLEMRREGLGVRDAACNNGSDP